MTKLSAQEEFRELARKMVNWHSCSEFPTERAIFAAGFIIPDSKKQTILMIFRGDQEDVLAIKKYLDSTTFEEE